MSDPQEIPVGLAAPRNHVHSAREGPVRDGYLLLAALLAACLDNPAPAPLHDGLPVDTSANSDDSTDSDDSARADATIPEATDTYGVIIDTDPRDTGSVPPRDTVSTWPHSGDDTAPPIDTGRADSDPPVPVAPLTDLWGHDLLLDDFHRHAHAFVEGRGNGRGGSDTCTMPDGRALARVWVTQGTSGYPAETRWYDVVAGVTVGARVRDTSGWTSTFSWYGEDLSACAPRRVHPALGAATCESCGPHPLCTAFLLPPFNGDPVHATVGGTHIPARCPRRCGDGIVQPKETCDDGNVRGGDGCSRHCVHRGCGDGVVDPASEGCDDGARVNGDGCSRLCRVEGCGDGLRQVGEACDDGNLDPDDGCDDACALRVTGLVSTRFAVCGLAADRTPACFGWGDRELSTVPDQPFDRLVTSSQTACGVDAAGLWTCWGDRSRIYSWTPPQGFGPYPDFGPGNPAFAAIDEHGDLLQWHRMAPTVAPGSWDHVTTSSNGGCALDGSTGQASCFGCVDCDPAPGHTFSAIDEWMGTACGILTDGSLHCWGRNDQGQNQAPAGTFRQVEVSAWTACALRDDGRAICWGDPATIPGASPRGLVLAEIVLVEDVAGQMVGCGVAVDGRVGCWGPAAGRRGLPLFPP